MMDSGVKTPSYKRSIFYFPIRRPVTVSMIVLTAVVFGTLSYRLLPVNMMPDITYPSLTVRTEYPGAAPEEVETTVTRPLEQALGVLRHLVEITSSSQAENSDILLEFDWGTDMNLATQDVREKLDLIFLSEAVKQPLILRYDPALDPLLRIGFTCDSLSLKELRRLCEDIVKQELEKLNGIAAVKIKGGEEEEIQVAIDAARLDLLDIKIEEVYRRLAAENINVAGGRLQEGESEYIVRSLNEFTNLSQIEEISVVNRQGISVRLMDFATVKRTSKEKTTATTVGGIPSVEIEVYTQSEANPIITSDLVKKRFFGWEKEKKSRRKGKDRRSSDRGGLKPLDKVLTERVKIHLLSDQAEFIDSAVNEVKSAAMMGAGLAIIVLFLFLGRIRDTLTVALVIPIALVCTFAAMHMAKVSINIMSLGGLALGIGMMVDNAIVVIESIFRHREDGAEPEEAAVMGTRVVGGAVMASTLTTIVVFFPIVFVTGIAGQVFGDMAITVIISISVSLIVALFFIPMLISKGIFPIFSPSETDIWTAPSTSFKSPWLLFIRKEPLLHNKNILLVIALYPLLKSYALIRLMFNYLFISALWLIHWSLHFIRLVSLMILAQVIGKTSGTLSNFSSAFKSVYDGINLRYTKLLRIFLKTPWVAVILLIAVCGYGFWAALPKMGGELIPGVSQSTFEAEFLLPVGTTIEQTAEAIAPIERAIEQMEGVLKVSSRTGVSSSGVENSDYGPNFSIVTVMLESGGSLEDRERKIVRRIRELAGKVPSLRMEISHPTLFTFKHPIEIILKADDLTELQDISERVMTKLYDISILTDIKSSIKTGYPEIVIHFIRQKLARLNMTARFVAERIRSGYQGYVSTKFREDERRIDIRVQMKESDRNSYHKLKNFIINPDQSIPVTLAEVADLTISEGPAVIRHYSGTRAAIITADVIDADLKTADEFITDVLRSCNLHEGVDYVISGQHLEMENSLASLKFALMLAVFLVYVVMASQFESFKAPFIILLTVPAAVAGVIIILWLIGLPISVMVFLGLIVLVGIVVNNSIILVDFTIQLNNAGESLENSIITAAQARLRPIMMTSMTTILALLPMALGVGEGVEIRRPMALTVIFGLTIGTMVTLFLIPMLLKLSYGLNSER